MSTLSSRGGFRRGLLLHLHPVSRLVRRRQQVNFERRSLLPPATVQPARGRVPSFSAKDLRSQDLGKQLIAPALHNMSAVLGSAALTYDSSLRPRMC
jgi:hypothetical protein